MKTIALFFVIALVPVMAAHAKTVNTTESGTNQKSVAGVAGPTVAARNSGPSQDGDRSSTRQPSKKTLKKARVTPPPPLHDPN